MNIQLLTPKFNTAKFTNNYSTNSISKNNSNLAPLQADTVSFSGKDKVISQAKNKVMQEWDPNGKNFQEIIDLCDDFEKPLEKLLVSLRRNMKHLVASQANPDAPIMPGIAGIKGRVKSPNETAVKANSRKIFNIDDIAKMGDVGGARIVFRSSSQKDFAMVFKELGNMMKQGLKIVEVENWRPSPKESYVSQKTLNKFEELCNEYGQYPEIRSRALPNGYTAVHVTCEIDGKYLEIQLMGIDMEITKEVQDPYYKHYCNKKLSSKYQIIQDMFDRVFPTLDAFQQETLLRYQKDSFDHARKIPANPVKHKVKIGNTFLPFPYSLPQELSYTNIYRLKCICEKADKAAKASKK